MINWPKPLSNIAAPFVAWVNRFLAAARQCTPIYIEGYRIEPGSDGFRAHKNFQTSGGVSSKTPDANYKGLYVPGQTYNALEWVVVQAGVAAGAYISTADSNSNSPVTGINWVQFSALPQWF